MLAATVGSINGLVCLVNQNQNELFLWNPIIGRYKEFTIPREYVPKKRYRRRYTCLIGFSWDCLENNYQVLVCYLFATFNQGFVYSSNSNSWAKLFVPHFVSVLSIPEPVYPKEYATPCCIVKNCPYWYKSDYYHIKNMVLISLVKFEVQTQKFRSLPDINYDEIVRGGTYSFVNVKDCLAIMVYRS